LCTTPGLGVRGIEFMMGAAGRMRQGCPPMPVSQPFLGEPSAFLCHDGQPWSAHPCFTIAMQPNPGTRCRSVLQVCSQVCLPPCSTSARCSHAPAYLPASMLACCHPILLCCMSLLWPLLLTVR